jgi:hypothetical protein
VGKRHRDELTVACDGQRTFRVFEDEVRVGPASALDEGRHGNLAQLVDGSWLLGCRLSGGEAVDVDGRTGYRVIASVSDGPVAAGPLSWLPGWWLPGWWLPGWWLPAVAFVDASSGRLLRLTRYSGGRAATRLELRSLSDVGSDDFGFTPPDGLPVVEERERDRSGGSDDDDDDDDDLQFFGPDGRRSSPPEEVRSVVDAVKKQVDETVAAARGFLGSFLGGRRLVGLAGLSRAWPGLVGLSRRGTPGGRRSSRAGLPRPGSGRRAASGRSRCRRTRARPRRRRRSGGRRSRARPRVRAAGP